MEITHLTWTVIEMIDGEATVVGAFDNREEAELRREKIIREHARESVACGTGPEGIDPEKGNVEELAGAFRLEIEVQ